MQFDLSPETKAMLNQLEETNRKTQKLIDQLRQPNSAVDRFMRSMETGFKELLQSSFYRKIQSIERAGSFFHPMYTELFGSDFSIDDVRHKWNAVQEYLCDRFPAHLDNNNRKERYIQILKCQAIGAYIPVCRSIYPELEALLRDKMLLADPIWKKEWEGKAKPRERISFQSTELNKIVREEHPEKKLLYEDQLPRSEWVVAAEFTNRLKKCFASFDPMELENDGASSARHLHAHGWKTEAGFVDGLNGVLLFDYALQSIDRNTTIGLNESKK